MKKSIIFGVGGFILGAIISMMVAYNMAPGMMMVESESKYGFDETVTALEQSVKDHNWKMPTVHNLQKTMKKFGKDVRAVKVFELCHPDHAEKILKANDERIVSSLMPCRVAVYEKADGKVYLSRMNSALMAGMMGGLVDEVMSVAYKENEEIVEDIIKK